MPREHPDLEKPNLTPMIDIVFQMIIFFLYALQLDKAKFDPHVDLPVAPHAEPMRDLAHSTIHIVVDRDGDARIGSTYVSDATLAGILASAARDHGSGTPVVIRGARHVRHRSIARVMDVVTAAGLHTISYAAIKERI